VKNRYGYIKSNASTGTISQRRIDIAQAIIHLAPILESRIEIMSHTYAIDASNLVGQCLEQVNDLLLLHSHGKRKRNGDQVCLQSLRNSLKDCYDCLYEFFADVVNDEKENSNEQSCYQTDVSNSESYFDDHSLLLKMADQFKNTLVRQQRYQQNQNPYSSSHIVSSQHPYGRSRDRMNNSTTTIDSMLFRLTVILQLCLVRIDDARLAVTGRRLKDTTTHNDMQLLGERKNFNWILGFSLATTTYFPIRWNTTHLLSGPRMVTSGSPSNHSQNEIIVTAVTTIAQLGTTAALLYGLNWNWSTLWMKSKMNSSDKEVRSWVQQWKIILNRNDMDIIVPKQRVTTSTLQPQRDDAIKKQKIIDYALDNSAKVRSVHTPACLESCTFSHFYGIAVVSGIFLGFTRRVTIFDSKTCNGSLLCFRWYRCYVYGR
jgi:hypothetical protein